MTLRSLRKALASGRLIAFMALTALVTLRVWDPGPLETARHKIFDLYQVVQPRSPVDFPVLIVDIDDRSLRQIGQWPWSRSVISDLVNRLAAAGAVVIGFDVLFAEPDRLSPRRLADMLKSFGQAGNLQSSSLPDSDVSLALAMSRTLVVLGQAGQNKKDPRDETAAEPTKASVVTIGGDPRGFLLQFPHVLRNLPILEQAAQGRGLLSIQPERDGIVRRIPTVAASQDLILPAFSIELLRVATGTPSLVVKSDEAGVRSVVVGDGEVLTDYDGQVWLHFSRHDVRRYLSAADVLGGADVTERAKGKIVLLGTSAVGLFDLKSTPTDPVMPGVEIHAQAIENIMANSLLYRPNYALGAEVCLAVVLGLAMLIAVPKLGALTALLVGFVHSAMLVALSWYLYTRETALLDVSFPLLASLIVFLILTFVNYIREEQRRAQIRSAFSQYLSSDLVEQLTREPERLVLGGETRVMSILFSDVRGFTAIAEGFKSNPQGLTALMNRLLTPLSKAVIKNRGTIDKYIGDAIMAFWNAPLDDPDHAPHACEAALEILRCLEILNAERRNEAAGRGEEGTDMQVGIGISTGTSVVGNMGSDIRFDYSVLGDSVNLASRLEGLTAHYGLRILICPETARLCAGRFAIVNIDDVRVKGRQEVVKLHALVGNEEVSRNESFRVFRGAFEHFRDRYRNADWSEARRALSRVRRATEDPQLLSLLDLYQHRLEALEGQTMPRDWDGVYPARLDFPPKVPAQPTN
jgi:adenylate cyclase